MAGLACIRAALLSPERASRRDIYIPPASIPPARPASAGHQPSERDAALVLGLAGLHERPATGAQY